MAKGASGSQASTAVTRGSSGAPPTAAGLRKRSTRTAGGGGGGGSQPRGGLNFFTDDTIGIKVSPTVVMCMSLGFICFVTLLHIIGKIRGV
ncbi:hypothetical protein WJX81_004651 [Elliptochloris bilobata]|uniref:Protein transport protein Sec61 subunit beta n=1 Tax=Elliptochloris bilobata TaxID=381761 RepID=A0AAW1RH75_9CHLO